MDPEKDSNRAVADKSVLVRTFRLNGKLSLIELSILAFLKGFTVFFLLEYRNKDIKEVLKIFFLEPLVFFFSTCLFFFYWKVFFSLSCIYSDPCTFIFSFLLNLVRSTSSGKLTVTVGAA